jgi:hypothetical protein
MVNSPEVKTIFLKIKQAGGAVNRGGFIENS